MAVTRAGLSPGEFDALTLDEWSAIATSVVEIEESRERLEMERARLLYFGAMYQNLREGTTPEMLLPFPWDSDKKQVEKHITPVSEVDIERMRKRWINDE